MTAADHPPSRQPAACAERAALVGNKTSVAGCASNPSMLIADGAAIVGFPKTAAALRSLDHSVASLRATIAKFRAATGREHADAG